MQPSATHPSATDKTQVNMTWLAPGGESMTSVTVWYVNYQIINYQLVAIAMWMRTCIILFMRA